MLQIPKEHRIKVDKAIGICEKGFNQFISHIEKVYDKKTAAKMKYFLLSNTIFAGGVFRSCFTDTPVNDIDVFFTSEDAAIEFRHIFAKNNVTFREGMISNKNTYNWNINFKEFIKKATWGHYDKKTAGELEVRYPTISFITQWADEPDTLLNSFDFSFNQHYYCLNDAHLRFDLDTFAKKGKVVNAAKDPLTLYLRALKFLKQGFQIDGNSMFALVQHIVQQQSGKDLDYEQAVNDMTSGGYGGGAIPDLQLSGERYDEDSYFNVDIIRDAGKKMKALYATDEFVVTTAAPGAWAVADHAHTITMPEALTEGHIERIYNIQREVARQAVYQQGFGLAPIGGDRVALNNIAHPAPQQAMGAPPAITPEDQDWLNMMMAEPENNT